MNEKEIDRKSKHCRKHEDHHSPNGLREEEQFSGQVIGIWDAWISLLLSKYTEQLTQTVGFGSRISAPRQCSCADLMKTGTNGFNYLSDKDLHTLFQPHVNQSPQSPALSLEVSASPVIPLLTIPDDLKYAYPQPWLVQLCRDIIQKWEHAPGSLGSLEPGPCWPAARLIEEGMLGQLVPRKK